MCDPLPTAHAPSAEPRMRGSGAEGPFDDRLVAQERRDVDVVVGDLEVRALPVGDPRAAIGTRAARLSPAAVPIPISAEPASCMIVRTSAKSRLIRPGIVIRSVMPCTP